MLDLPCPVDGNEACVSLLKDCLAEAERGDIAHVCVILTRSPVDTFAKFSGVAGHEIAAYYCAGLLQAELMKVNQNRMNFNVNKDAPANRVFYNIAKMPACFDFVGSLIDAEMQRIREGAPPPLKVAWYWGQDGNVTAALNTPQRDQNFNGILRPLVRLLCAEEDQGALDGREIDHCTLKPVVDAYKRGEQVPRFMAPQEFIGPIGTFMQETCGQPPVTITLREADHTPHRNSNIPEWLKFAEWLESQGEKVIFVRDTAKSREPLDGTMTCFAASENLLVRAALYQVAKANLFVSNGPAMLALFMDRPWLMFNEVQEDGSYKANTSQGWLRCSGITPPEQWPWCRDDQRIVWQRDTFEVMREAWQQHIAPALQAAA